MAGRYPVKIFHCEQRDAPAIDGTPGSFINVLKKCLIEGFGEVAAVSGEITDGLCTIYVNGGESFEKNHIVLISGTNLASVNGEQRVEETTNSSFTFSTIEPNQTLIGSITVKYAPVGGWITPYTGTNEAVFKATAPDSSGIYFHVNDTNALYATMRMYGVMSSLNTGNGEYPALPAMGFIFMKSYQANSNAKTWELIADDYTCYYGINRQYGPTTRTLYKIGYSGFGDYVEEKTRSSGNAFVRAIVTNDTYTTGSSNAYQGSICMGGFYDGRYSDLYVYRDIETGIPARGLLKPDIPFWPGNWRSGWLGNNAYNGLNKEVIITRTGIYRTNSREIIPGWYVINNKLPTSDFAARHWKTTNEVLNAEDKLFLWVIEGTYGSGRTYLYSNNASLKAADNGNEGGFNASLIDITGPWR